MPSYYDQPQFQLGPLSSNAISQQANQAQINQAQVSNNLTYQNPSQIGRPTSYLDNIFGKDSINTLGLGLGALQTLGGLWNSYNSSKLAKESLGLQKKAFETNLKNNTKTYNTSLEDRIRARYATEGRSDQADDYIDNHSL